MHSAVKLIDINSILHKILSQITEREKKNTNPLILYRDLFLVIFPIYKQNIMYKLIQGCVLQAIHTTIELVFVDGELRRDVI